MKKTVFLDKQQVNLTDNHYITSGGEGDIYKKDNWIIKLYQNPAVIESNKLLKLKSLFNQDEIIVPKGLVFDNSQNVIGYYMPFVCAESMVKSFSNEWRQQNSFDMKKSVALISNMQKVQSHIHSKNVIMVDANEMNYLFKNEQPIYLDSDSWQFDNYQAKVIMPSIRDWHSKEFNELTDWFSWGIVSFQVLTGIHPYKGFHKVKSLEERMKQNISVFNADVKLNSAVRDFGDIPTNIKDWYYATFEKGSREIPPPIVANTATRVAKKTTTYSQDKLKFSTYATLNDTIQAITMAKYVILTDKKYNLTTKQYVSKDSIQLEGKEYVLSQMKNPELMQGCLLNSRLYSLSESGITELSIYNEHFAVKSKYEMYHAKSYFNVLMTELLNTKIITLLHAEGKTIGVAVGLKEYNVIDCMTEVADYVVVLAQHKKTGLNYILEYQYKENQFQLVDSQGTDLNELNVAFLAHKKLLIMCTDDTKLSLKHYPTQQTKMIIDKNMTFNMKLFTFQNKLLCYSDKVIQEINLS